MVKTENGNQELVELKQTVASLVLSIDRLVEEHKRLVQQADANAIAIARLEERTMAIKERLTNAKEEQQRQGQRLWYVFEKVIQAATTAGLIWLIVQKLVS